MEAERQREVISHLLMTSSNTYSRLGWPGLRQVSETKLVPGKWVVEIQGLGHSSAASLDT